MNKSDRSSSPGRDAANAPSDGRVVRTLKDGYWDRTEIVAMADGSQRVRKRTKGAEFGPWGVRSLRREISYLNELPPRARAVFPPVLAAWDDQRDDAPDVGYEMPYYARHVDAGDLARRVALAQVEVDAFQDALADALLMRLHEPIAAPERLSAHLRAVVEEAWHGLEAEPALQRLLRAERIELNGTRVLGPRAAFARILEQTDALRALDHEPDVRLHGDFFLENILWRPAGAEHDDEAPRLLLVDPVSVAGVLHGPAIFDLVKYESYATGELPALRTERVEVNGFDDGNSYEYHIRWPDPAIQAFRARDWHSRFRRAFEQRHGPVNRRLYRLIDGYFSAAMALNTGGIQRRARLLKATLDFNGVLAS